MGIGGYRYKYKDFCEKGTFPKSINREENDHNKGAQESLVKDSPLSSLPFMMMCFLEEIQSSNNYVDIFSGRMLERVQELLQMISVSMNFILY